MGKMEDLIEKIKTIAAGSDGSKVEAMLADVETTLHKHWDELEAIAKDVDLAGMVKKALQEAGAPGSMLSKDHGKIVVEALRELVDKLGGRDKSSFVEFMSHPRFKEFMTEFSEFNAIVRKKL